MYLNIGLLQESKTWVKELGLILMNKEITFFGRDWNFVLSVARPSDTWDWHFFL